MTRLIKGDARTVSGMTKQAKPVTPDLYKYNALRLSYENASIFAAFTSAAFIPGPTYDITSR